MPRCDDIAQKIKHLKGELGSTNLIAVTKYTTIEDAILTYQAEQFDLGENKVVDLKTRASYFSKNKYNNVRWHYIGHLQTNKVRDLLKIPNLYAIHSVDSLRLIEEMLKHQASFQGEELNIFLQVNTSQEDSKSGFETMDDLEKAIEVLLHTHSPFKLKGLMTMGTVKTENFAEEAKRCFTELVKIKNYIQNKFTLIDLKLSMGMSQDYQIAKELGADYVRIGSLIFKM